MVIQALPAGRKARRMRDGHDAATACGSSGANDSRQNV